jgi:hypothetical protein
LFFEIHGGTGEHTRPWQSFIAADRIEAITTTAAKTNGT